MSRIKIDELPILATLSALESKTVQGGTSDGSLEETTRRDSTDDEGSQSGPVFSNYRPQFYFN